MGDNGRLGLSSSIPNCIEDSEPLHRRIHPSQVKRDGQISSAAFKDPEASVDRGRYRSVQQSLENYPEHGLARIHADEARSLGQDVVADPELLNPAHALIRGRKPRKIARALAERAEWVQHVRPAAVPKVGDG